LGGWHLDGNVRGIAIEQMLQDIERIKETSKLTILDAGSGMGGLSVYLACLGFNVIGVDISETACRHAEELAQKYGLSRKCTFLCESLEKISIPDASIDIIVGLHTFHHFIKYNGVPAEFNRILKQTGKGYFAYGFGENPIYKIFHDKKKMQKLGDVVLNKKLIEHYFGLFDVSIYPIDLFSMINKFIVRLFGWKSAKYWRSTSRIVRLIDFAMPKTRLILFLSGTIMTTVVKEV
jgi:ubiquinone/menaquinone biosynthesis C-methylase UbiE